MQSMVPAVAGFTDPPAPGAVVELTPGVLWARFAMPFALDHVNVFLLDDEGGWAVVDTGLGDEATRAAWRMLLAGPLQGQALTRLIITHHHPDHMGLAGWMAAEFDTPVHMTETEYLLAQYLSLDEREVDEEKHRSFYRRHGLDARYADTVISQGHCYRRMTTGFPWSYRQLMAGEEIRVGRRRFEIITGGGHSSDQAMLFCRADGILLAADQVLLRISPNISVTAVNPEADPLRQYLRSLAHLRASVPDGVLVLPGHNLPFRGLHARIGELIAHHETRCGIIAEACAGQARTAAELVPLLFLRALDPHQMSFAFSETLAHVNMMVRQGRLSWIGNGEVQRAIAN